MPTKSWENESVNCWADKRWQPTSEFEHCKNKYTRITRAWTNECLKISSTCTEENYKGVFLMKLPMWFNCGKGKVNAIHWLVQLFTIDYMKVREDHETNSKVQLMGNQGWRCSTNNLMVIGLKQNLKYDTTYKIYTLPMLIRTFCPEIELFNNEPCKLKGITLK